MPRDTFPGIPPTNTQWHRAALAVCDVTAGVTDLADLIQAHPELLRDGYRDLEAAHRTWPCFICPAAAGVDAMTKDRGNIRTSAMLAIAVAAESLLSGFKVAQGRVG
jgi:hypothetical protein